MRASIIVGIDRTSYQNHSKLYGYLSVLDICFSCLIIAPLVVTFWCSTWIALSKIFVFQPLISVYISVTFGFTVLISFTALQKQLQVLFSEHIGNRFLYFFSSRLYTQIFGIASVSSWYGVWNAFDTLTGGNIKITVVIVLISYVGLFCTKTVRNITSSPFALITDRRQGYFDVPTLFQWSNIWKKNKFLYILDSIFSVFIVGTLVILVWRGAWCLLDQTIFPGNETYLLSGWISLGIGYSIVFATFALQRFMKILIRMYHGWKRLVIIDTYVVISFCGTINIWRGIWILLEEYVNLENSLTNCVILHFLSFFILVIFNSSNTLLVRGVYIDAEENGEDCVEFPCYYFRLRFQEKQKKKTLVELNNVTNKVLNVEKKDDCRLNDDRDKKSETEIISEINHQQVPLIVNDSPNTGNGEVNSNNDEKPNS
ncbi:uncharacterized protein fusl isoform X2 [Planococcus citri]|uniref:uncharacterized protein fusl isoform X2 n=1 Tax=Planococcus citri TaxID=170843 RepID=UPI0031F9F852